MAAQRQHEHGNASALPDGVTQTNIPLEQLANEIVICGKRYRAIDRGNRAGDDFNVCFYLSCSAGSPAAAISLKRELAALATRYSQQMRGSAAEDFSRLGAMASVEVFVAHACLHGPILSVTRNIQGGAALLYAVGHDQIDVNKVPKLIQEGAHFRQLVEV